MRAYTHQVKIAADAGTVFSYVADPRNLPRWAVAFAKEVRRNGDGWIVTVADGPELSREVMLELRTSAQLGVVDFLMQPAPGVTVPATTRVVDAGDGAVYTFTLFQPSMMADEVFEAQVRAVELELGVLKDQLEGAA